VRRQIGRWAAVVVCTIPAAALAAPSAPLTFKGATLGMSQAAWRAMAPPGALPSHAAAACSDDSGGGPKRTAAEQAAGEVVCGYVSHYGRFSLPISFPFDGTYRMTQLRYVFSGDRLTTIRIRASIDAYDTLVARLRTRYGPADRMTRDTVKTELGRTPRVIQTWTTPGGTVQLMDPVPPYTELGLSFTAGKAAPDTKVAAVTGHPSS
jgi:hypothetical protein